jgi:hypothetical protein
MSDTPTVEQLEAAIAGELRVELELGHVKPGDVARAARAAHQCADEHRRRAVAERMRRSRERRRNRAAA